MLKILLIIVERFLSRLRDGHVHVSISHEQLPFNRQQQNAKLFAKKTIITLNFLSVGQAAKPSRPREIMYLAERETLRLVVGRGPL